MKVHDEITDPGLPDPGATEGSRLSEALLQELDRLRQKVKQQETMIRAQAERIKELTTELDLVNK